MSESVEIVVIGGGYAGTMAANRLTAIEGARVTLINPRPVFVDRIRLHQLAAGTGDAVVEYGRLLNPRVRIVVDAVELIEPGERRLALASGGSVSYDRLVYAVGSRSADPDVPGASRYALPLADLEEGRRLRAVLDGLPAGAPVVVVGAGPTGIEAAAELAEAGRPVTLVCGNVLGPYLHPRGREVVAARLAALGVSVLHGAGSRAVEVREDAVVLADGRVVPGAATVWTVGFRAPDLARRSGLPTDAAGRLLTDETLTCVGDERIVATGDAAAPSSMPYRMSCQAAMQLGPQAAETVRRRLAGREPARVRVGFAGQCISLGRRSGVFQFARRSDLAVAALLRGRVGATVKETICRGILWQLATEARHPGVLRWWLPGRSRAGRARTAVVPERVGR